MNKNFISMTKDELLEQKEFLERRYSNFKNMGLKLTMERGVPCSEQLALSTGMLSCVDSPEQCVIDGVDCRSYGLIDGIKEAKKLFSDMLGVGIKEIILGGNSSLNMMYDAIARAMTLGVLDGEKPWGKYDKVKFICPSPGYDRHFAICQQFGIEMTSVEMTADGIDMDAVEMLVKDKDYKGIWCVPKYSNPDGITYSEETVKRLANMNPAAPDFRIFWDNAYCVHHLSEGGDELADILAFCKESSRPNMPFIFGSTSKISFPGSGVGMLAASENNIEYIKKQISIQTIGPDKLNQLRHVMFYKDFGGIKEHMKKHASILQPKFEAVLSRLSQEFDGTGISEWNTPRGGYFISLNVMDGTAKRTVHLSKEAGISVTPAGATYPYGIDPRDRNIRIAPTFPALNDLKIAIELLCISAKLAAVEKLLS